MWEMAAMYHEPVLLTETVGALVQNPDGIYVDVTFGGGGHSREILKRLGGNGRLFGFDQDSECLAADIDDTRFQFIPQNFKNIAKWLEYYKCPQVDGIIADLGVSSHQFDTPQRGFSYRFPAPLDMRMNTSKEFSAADVVNQYPQSHLTAILSEYGELQNAKRMADLIAGARPLSTTDQLTAAVAPLLPKGKENKILSQLFQAIRIEVNGEVEALKQLLLQSVRLLKSGGRIAILSYHSIEDRLVKNFFRAGNFEGEIEKDFYGNPLTPFRSITRKPVIPSDSETEANPRARSAKLRVAEKI